MRRRFGRAVLCIGMLLASPQLLAQRPGGGPPPQNGQPAPRFAWWRDERYQKHLGLTTDQGTRLEAAWQAALPELRKGRDDLDRQEAELSRLIETNADETVVTAFVRRDRRVHPAVFNRLERCGHCVDHHL